MLFQCTQLLEKTKGGKEEGLKCVPSLTRGALQANPWRCGQTSLGMTSCAPRTQPLHHLVAGPAAVLQGLAIIASLALHLACLGHERGILDTI